MRTMKLSTKNSILARGDEYNVLVPFYTSERLTRIDIQDSGFPTETMQI